MSNDIRIGVAGAGATGGYLAATLSAAGFDVTLLARGPSTTTIRDKGITVEQPDGSVLEGRPGHVVEAGDQIEPVDIALFCVKSYDTAKAAKDVGNLVGSEGTILCLQNGVANEEELAKVYGEARVLSGVLYIGAERTGPAHIACATSAKVIFGPYSPASRASVAVWEPLRNALVAAGIDATIDPQIRTAKWQKFLFNCGLNPLTAITGRRLGEIRSQPAGRDLYTRLVSEAIDAAQASGVELPHDALEQAEATADRMDISSSMAEDLEAGRGLELNAFTGHVLGLAEQHGTKASTTAVIHSVLQVLDLKK